MIFSLEILQADHGDCLLLHYGKKSDPKLIVIDGGPDGIYTKFLKPRLLKIKTKLAPDTPLPLSMVMVSHLDDDHVNGVLALTEEIANRKSNNQKQEFDFDNLWVNTFDDIIGNIQIPVISAIASSTQPASISSIPGLSSADHSVAAVIASTGQGRQLRDNAKLLSATVNNPFEELKKGKANLVRGDGEGSQITWDTGLKITVVHPNTERLNKLQKQWDSDLKKAKQKGDNSIIVASLTNSDTSPFNLSSIVCLVEVNKKKILLTGDGRSDDIMAGLKLNKLLDKNGSIHVDIMKMPHHGSIRDASTEFFEKVTADHYVISANGRFSNPDKELLDMMVDTKVKGTLHSTNQDGQLGLKAKLTAFEKKLKKAGSKLKVNFRKDTDPSIVVNLLEEINF